MPANVPRLAVRAVIVENARLLLVNAYAEDASDLWCAPGGGVVAGHDLPANLAREVREETGLTISVGRFLAVNEFHDPESGFHQVDLFFLASIAVGDLSDTWTDPEGVVTRRRFFSQDELRQIRFKPGMLPDLAFTSDIGARYDRLEQMVR